MAKDGYCYRFVLFGLYRQGTLTQYQVGSILQIAGAFPTFRRMASLIYSYVQDDVQIMIPRRTGNLLHFDMKCYRHAHMSTLWKLFEFEVVGADAAANSPQISVMDSCSTTGAMQHMRAMGLDVEKMVREQAVEFYTEGEGKEILQAAVHNQVMSASRSVKPKVVLKYTNEKSRMSETVMQTYYPEFEIEFSLASRHLHATAANCRQMEMEYCLLMAGYNKSLVIKSGDHEYPYADIGANFSHHLNRFNVHSCCGMLDTRDLQRRQDTRSKLNSLVLQGQMTPEEYNEIETGSSDRVCFGRAENCRIKAKTCFFFHATYDMTESDLVRILIRKNCITAYATIHFDDAMLITEKGTLLDIDCMWRKSVNNRGERMIHFNFGGDTSFTYSHRLDTFLALVQRGVVCSGGVAYICEKRDYRANTVFIKMTRVQSNVERVIASRLDTAYSSMNVTSKIVRYYELREAILVKEGFRLVRKDIVVSKALFDAILSRALQLEKGAFTVTNLYKYAGAFNHRATVDGGTFETPEDMMDPDDLFVLVHALYAYAYCRKFSEGRVLQSVLAEENESQEMLSKSRTGRVVKSVTTKVSNAVTAILDRCFAAFDKWMTIKKTKNVEIGEFVEFVECSTLVQMRVKAGILHSEETYVEWDFDNERLLSGTELTPLCPRDTSDGALAFGNKCLNYVSRQVSAGYKDYLRGFEVKLDMDRKIFDQLKTASIINTSANAASLLEAVAMAFQLKVDFFTQLVARVMGDAVLETGAQACLKNLSVLMKAFGLRCNVLTTEGYCLRVSESGTYTVNLEMILKRGVLNGEKIPLFAYLKTEYLPKSFVDHLLEAHSLQHASNAYASFGGALSELVPKTVCHAYAVDLQKRLFPLFLRTEYKPNSKCHVGVCDPMNDDVMITCLLSVTKWTVDKVPLPPSNTKKEKKMVCDFIIVRDVDFDRYAGFWENYKGCVCVLTSSTSHFITCYPIYTALYACMDGHIVLRGVAGGNDVMSIPSSMVAACSEEAVRNWNDESKYSVEELSEVLSMYKIVTEVNVDEDTELIEIILNAQVLVPHLSSRSAWMSVYTSLKKHFVRWYANERILNGMRVVLKGLVARVKSLDECDEYLLKICDMDELNPNCWYKTLQLKLRMIADYIALRERVYDDRVIVNGVKTSVYVAFATHKTKPAEQPRENVRRNVRERVLKNKISAKLRNDPRALLTRDIHTRSNVVQLGLPELKDQKVCVTPYVEEEERDVTPPIPFTFEDDTEDSDDDEPVAGAVFAVSAEVHRVPESEDSRDDPPPYEKINEIALDVGSDDSDSSQDSTDTVIEVRTRVVECALPSAPPREEMCREQIPVPYEPYVHMGDENYLFKRGEIVEVDSDPGYCVFDALGKFFADEVGRDYFQDFFEQVVGKKFHVQERLPETWPEMADLEIFLERTKLPLNIEEKGRTRSVNTETRLAVGTIGVVTDGRTKHVFTLEVHDLYSEYFRLDILVAKKKMFAAYVQAHPEIEWSVLGVFELLVRLVDEGARTIHILTPSGDICRLSEKAGLSCDASASLKYLDVTNYTYEVQKAIGDCNELIMRVPSSLLRTVINLCWKQFTTIEIVHDWHTLLADTYFLYCGKIKAAVDNAMVITRYGAGMWWYDVIRVSEQDLYERMEKTRHDYLVVYKEPVKGQSEDIVAALSRYRAKSKVSLAATTRRFEKRERAVYNLVLSEESPKTGHRLVKKYIDHTVYFDHSITQLYIRTNRSRVATYFKTLIEEVERMYDFSAYVYIDIEISAGEATQFAAVNANPAVILTTVTTKSIIASVLTPPLPILSFAGNYQSFTARSSVDRVYAAFDKGCDMAAKSRNAVSEYLLKCSMEMTDAYTACGEIMRKHGTFANIQPGKDYFIAYNEKEALQNFFMQHSEGRAFTHAFDGTNLVAFDYWTGIYKSKKSVVMLHKKTKVMHGAKVFEDAKRLLNAHIYFCPVELQIGPPGCGKTHAIVNAVKSRDFIISGTRANVENLRSRLPKSFSGRVMTMDALTLKLADPNNEYISGLVVDVLYVDECFMVHYGQIAYIVHLLGCNKVKAYGDPRQIAYTERSSFVKMDYSNISAVRSSVVETGKTYRVPKDIANFFNSYYLESFTKKMPNLSGYKDLALENMVPMTCGFTTENPITNSVSMVHVKSIKQLAAVKNFKEAVILTYRQSVKLDVLREFPELRKPRRVYTINEFEGKDADHVILFRCEAKNLDIFSRHDQFLVALTRHKRSFVFCHQGRLISADDMVFNAVLSLCSVQSVGGLIDPLDTTEGLNDFSEEPEPTNFRKAAKKSGKKILPETWSPMITMEEYRSMLREPGQYSDHDVTIKYVTFRGELPLTNLENMYVANGFSDGLLMTFERVHDNTRALLPKLTNKRIVRKEPSLTVLQDFFNEHIPGGALYDYSWDPVIVQDTRIKLGITERFVFNPHNVDSREKSYDRLVPQLRTHMPMCRNPSMKEVMLGTKKRNLAAPKIAVEGNTRVVVTDMVANFIRTYIPKNLRHFLNIFRDNPIIPNFSLLHDWAQTQKSDLDKKINPDYSMATDDWSVYNLMNKPNPKPDTTAAGVYKYAQTQTIVYHDKEINAIMCVIMRQAKKRLLAVLHSKFQMFTDMSPEDFEKELNKRFSAKILRKKHKLEVDISKYDKSQGELLLLAELEIYRILGVPDFILKKWYLAHRNTVLIDRTNDIKFFIDFQRKSGNATTYLGNTIVLMLVLCTLFDLEKADMVVVSGDDSLIISDKPFPDRSTQCARIFNLESKFLRFKSSYFCSKFLVEVDDQIRFVPDPFKLLIKLGRGDLVNYEHVEEYRKSLTDLLEIYHNSGIDAPLQKALDERYGAGITGVDELLANIVSFISTEENFKMLYSTFEGMRMTVDPSRPSLDV